MKNFLQKRRQLLIGILVGALSIYLISSMIIEKRLANLQNNIETDLTTSENELMALASAISRGEANVSASKVMPDCSTSERVRFEGGLGRLSDGLSNTELKELDTLFSRCAPVSIIRRSAMVTQFEAELKRFTHLIEQRKILGEYSNYDSRSLTWDDLLQTEQSIVSISFDSVNLQYEIILQLLSGLDVNSTSANELKTKGQSIRVELTDLVNKATELREGLN